jgi:hypothetical protein
MSAVPAFVENRVYLKAMRQCLTEYRDGSTDHSPLAQLMALHRAGYPADLIEKNLEKILLRSSTLS